MVVVDTSLLGQSIKFKFELSKASEVYIISYRINTFPKKKADD